MAQNITLLGASYSAVPAVMLPKTGGGNALFADPSPVTAVAADVAQGKFFINSSGDLEEGTAGGGGERTVIVPEQTINASSPYTAIQFNAPLVAGETYIATVNGETKTLTAVSQYGSIYLVFASAIYIDYSAPSMYFDVDNTSLYGTYTVKVEQESSSGGGGSATLITKTITANGTYSAEDDDADGYSEVTVNVSSGSSKNTQTVQSTSRRNNTALGSITSLTCSKEGTYDVYWTCARSSTSGTWGSQLYINGTAYESENTTFTNHVQVNHLSNVSIPAGATVAVYGRSRSGYYIYAPQLTIVEA